MLIKEQQIPYLTNAIVTDLLKSKLVTFPLTLDKAKEYISEVISEDVTWEKEIEDDIKDIIAEQEEENEYMMYDIDKKELFKLMKKKFAEEENFPIDREERLTKLAEKIIDYLWDKGAIDFDIEDGKIRNIIFNAMIEFLNKKFKIEEIVYDKIKNYKRKLIPGSEEYNIVFQKLYEQELKKQGLL